MRHVDGRGNGDCDGLSGRYSGRVVSLRQLVGLTEYATTNSG